MKSSKIIENHRKSSQIIDSFSCVKKECEDLVDTSSLKNLETKDSSNTKIQLAGNNNKSERSQYPCYNHFS